MVAIYFLTKGEHPFSSAPGRLCSLLDSKPVGLNALKYHGARDFISSMLSHDPKNTPTADKALKHRIFEPRSNSLKCCAKWETKKRSRPETITHLSCNALIMISQIEER